MAGTNPLTGARFPTSSDAPNVFQDLTNLNNDLSPLTVKNFTSTTTRNTAFTNWVNAGNTMRDGLMCTVAGMPMVYRSGAWHGLLPQSYLTGAATGTTETVTTNVMTINVTDPGYPYLLMVSASVLLTTLGVDVVVHPEVRVNGSPLNPWGADIGPGGSNRVASLPATAISTSRTGTATVTLTIVKASGSAGNGYVTAASSVYNMLSVLVVPT